MKKTIWKPLLITAAVLAVCVGLILLLNLLPDADSQTDATPTPTPSQLATSIYLLNGDYYSLDYVDVQFRDKPEDNLRIYSYTEEDRRVFRIEPSVEGWGYKHDALSSVAWNAVSISALATVTESTDDLAYYGLDDPEFIFTIAFEDGETHELRIGKTTAVDDSYYGMIDDDPAVYAVSKYTVQRLAGNELSYREFDFFDTTPYYDQEMMVYDAAGGITYIKLYNETRGLNFEFRQRTAEELAGDMPAGTTTWQMLAPIKSECNDTNVEDSFVDVLVGLTIDAVVTDVADDTLLEEYGLDDPLELWLEGSNGDKVHYYIGDYNDGGECYVMVEGCNSIMKASGFGVSALKTDYIDMMFKLLWITNISDVARVEYNLGGTKRLLTIIENYTDEEGNDVFYATLDGRAVSSTNAKRLFTYALDLLIVGDLEDDFSIKGKKAEYSITIELNDGTRNTLDLYAMNERQYAASVDGEDAEFYVNISDIKALKSAFDYQDRGEEIPRAS